MKSFKELGIRAKTLSGAKIKLEEVLDKQIVVTDYRIEESKYGRKPGRCLTLQFIHESESRILFTGSEVLMDTIEQVPKHDFPFATTIIKEMEWYQFT